MATLSETSTWTAGIYQLERTDLWDAGTAGSGIANLQAKQLANRTLWLYNQVNKINFNIDYPDQTVGTGGVVNSKGTTYVFGFPMNDWDYTTPNDGITRNYLATISCFANFTYGSSANIQMVLQTTTSGPTSVQLITANLRQPYQVLCVQKQIQLGPNVRLRCYYTNNATGANATFSMGSFHIREI